MSLGRLLVESGEAAAGAMQPHSHLCPGHAEHASRVLARDPVALDKQKYFTVAFAQGAERGADGVGARIVAGMDDEAGSLVLEPGAQHAATLLGAALVCELTPRDAEQPGQRIGRQIVEPAPGDREGLGDDILDSFGRASGDVTTNARNVGAEDDLETIFARGCGFFPSRSHQARSVRLVGERCTLSKSFQQLFRLLDHVGMPRVQLGVPVG